MWPRGLWQGLSVWLLWCVSFLCGFVEVSVVHVVQFSRRDVEQVQLLEYAVDGAAVDEVASACPCDDGRCFGRYEIAESAFVVYHAERGEVFVGAHYRVDIYHHGGCIVAYGRDSFVGRQHALQHAPGGWI